MKVSIIIPILNEINYLRQCLDSIINNTTIIDDTEILLIDGGSKDGTIEIINEYVSKYKNIKYYKNLRGGILEAVSKMFPSNMKLYIYPTKRYKGDDIITTNNLEIDHDIKLIFNYLKERRFILDIISDMKDQLHISTREVNSMLKSGNEEWKKYVPDSVSKIIKNRGIDKDNLA